MISNKYKLVVLGPKELCMKPQMLKKCKKKQYIRYTYNFSEGKEKGGAGITKRLLNK